MIKYSEVIKMENPFRNKDTKYFIANLVPNKRPKEVNREVALNIFLSHKQNELRNKEILTRQFEQAEKLSSFIMVPHPQII